MSEKGANMVEGMLHRGARGLLETAGCGSPAAVPLEGNQALQVLDDSAERRLVLYAVTSSTACSSQTVSVLTLGEDVFAADAELATDLIAPGLSELANAIASAGFHDLSLPGSLLLQIKRGPLPAGNLLHRSICQERNMRQDLPIEDFGDELAGAVACVGRQDFRSVRKSQILACFENLVEHLERRGPLGRARRQGRFTTQNNAALGIDEVMGQIAGACFAAVALPVEPGVRIGRGDVRSRSCSARLGPSSPPRASAPRRHLP